MAKDNFSSYRLSAVPDCYFIMVRGCYEYKSFIYEIQKNRILERKDWKTQLIPQDLIHSYGNNTFYAL